MKLSSPVLIAWLVMLLLVVLFTAQRLQAATNWQFPLLRSPNDQLEREASASGSSAILDQSSGRASPALIGRHSGQLFSRNQGRFVLAELERLRELDLFQCVEPTRTMYENFVRQYNRTFQDSQDKLERLQLFALTLKRAIMLNRIVQNDILNLTNYQAKPQIRNYHFIEPLAGQNLALWYADITDCELGLIKHIVFDIFYLIDKNDLHLAYKLVREQSDHLASLLNDDGFEQVASILLARLYDRFRGDEKMDQLFQWPLYLKKLASFAYSQQQAQQADFKTQLSLVSFAYPAYFKDLKYNHEAINRTSDNAHANNEHKRYSAALNRKFSDLHERNRRLAIFRQRWSLVNQLNGQTASATADEQTRNESSRHLLPDWLRVQYLAPTDEQPAALDEGSGNSLEIGTTSTTTANNNNDLRSEKLVASDGGGGQSPDLQGQQQQQDSSTRPFKLTQFSDLTDLEFMAFLSNDFSLLDDNKQSALFLEQNFPVRPLDSRFRWEIAHELEMRRGFALTSSNLDLLSRSGDLTTATDRHLNPNNNNNNNNHHHHHPNHAQPNNPSHAHNRPSLRLAKQVVDELISDVGLPIGPVMVENISEEEHYRAFQKVADFFQKPYMLTASPASERLQSELTSSDLADERQRRYDQFKQNYGRFRAWFTKEDWRLSEPQMVAMLRLADMSWLEIKTSMFKVCCLSSENLAALSSTNATIQYMGSNNGLLCDQLTPPDTQDPLPAPPSGRQQPTSGANATPSKLRQQASELTALELYYYYSVHFNKHHLDRADFGRRLATFRRNIDAIRRHSCKRSLTLFQALKHKRADLLSTIDVLDPRRSHTDDLNLDRFEYFRLSRWTSPAVLRGADLVAAPARLQQAASSNSNFESSRAGVSYRRDYFAHLLDRATASHSHGPTDGTSSYASRLVDSWQDADDYANKYRENSVRKIYELVMLRYKFCMKTLKGIELSLGELRQQCQSNGPLGDQAAQLGGPGGAGALWSEEPQQQHQQQFGRLQLQQNQDQCAFYRQGLEPWAEGLVKQDTLLAQLIQTAKC